MLVNPGSALADRKIAGREQPDLTLDEIILALHERILEAAALSLDFSLGRSVYWLAVAVR